MMDALLLTIAKLANGTFRVARPLTRYHRRPVLMTGKASEHVAGHKTANGSLAKLNKGFPKRETRH